MDTRIPRDWGGTYETLELARLIEAPGWSADQAARAIRHYAQAAWIFPIGPRPDSWPLSSGAATVALKALIDTGVADRTVMGHASVGLWGWTGEQSERSRTAPHPITAALAGTVHNQFWVFHVRITRDTLNGTRHIQGFCYADNDPPEFARDTKWRPEPSITVNLSALLLPILARLAPK